MIDEELKKRGIDYLMAQREPDKMAHELNVRELAPLLKIKKSSVYEHMESLVETGVWKTRMAFDPALNRAVRVWWLV